MTIYDMMTNRLTNPIGFSLDPPRLSYKVRDAEGCRQAAARVRVARDDAMQEMLFDTGRREDIDSLCFVPPIALTPRTRYWWDVEVWSDTGDSARSAPAFFETGKMNEPWAAQWITPDVPGNGNLYKTLHIDRTPVSARVYAVGVGLYELYIDGRKVGDELLAPFCTAYDQWIQVQTYDVTNHFAGETPVHELMAMLGDGWYKGRFGFRGDSCLYGDTQALLLELHLSYADGTREVIATDDTWLASESRVRFANIYDGETYDATLDISRQTPVRLYGALAGATLVDRLSPPVRVTERLAPRSIFTTPAGETVLDLGQEITGYLEFRTQATHGTVLKLSYFELLQDGNYFRDNLRTAEQIFTYTADGTDRVVRPHFTFFGFRYVKLEGFQAPKLDDFTGCVVHSDIARTGHFSCSNEKVNRLAENALWSQRGNFLDVPTDCPQRDERMGWTGDAQAFAGTACFQMESAAFLAKYMTDLSMEQAKRNGSVPHVVPAMGLPGDGSCAWGDAATIIPWTLYLFYGDKALLEKQYGSMRDWVDWIRRTDDLTGGTRLWQTGFHFADWLALDTKDASSMGGTDPYFVASAYYYYSTSLLVKAARVLGRQADEATYGKLLDEILDALTRTYFTPAGHLAQSTQTGYICALFMAFAPKEHIPQLTALLEREFDRSGGKLRTGFVGTAYLCRVLSQAGLNTLAYSLLLNEEYPGWLYEVNMGATTIWERWNSVMPDGHVSDTGMNSLNHYAYGAVMEWAFRDVAGINPVEEAPGFRHALLRPRPDERLSHAGAALETAVGRYESRWSIEEGLFRWVVQVPFGATATAVFPRADREQLAQAWPQLPFTDTPDGVCAFLIAGRYDFAYAPKGRFTPLGLSTPFRQLLENEKAHALLAAHAPGALAEGLRKPAHRDMPLRDILALPFAQVQPGTAEKLAEALASLA